MAHIHIPKPLHGWRQFVGEVGIIVLGVLIALGAEQLVQSIHWRTKVRESEAALGRDLAVQSDIASERVAMVRCQDDRLALLRSAILASGARWNTNLPATTDGVTFTKPYGVPVRLWTSQLWDSLVADGTVAHFDADRARAYALLYESIRLRGADNEREIDDETALSVLGDKNVPLSGDAKLRLVQIIDGLRLRNGVMAGSSRQILRRISDSGDLPSAVETERRLREHSEALKCRFAAEALKDRIAKDWLTLHR